MNFTSHNKLLILGFGGHARSAADLALACGYTELLFVDANAKLGESFLGHPVMPDFGNLDDSWCDAFAASGDGRQRCLQCAAIDRMGLNLVSLVSPSASVGVGGVIGAGCFVGHHAHVGPMATIGRACIINTGAIVEHECAVGDYAHVSINATLAGRSRLGDLVFLGAGATVIDGISIDERVTIGAGSVVIDPIVEPGTYVGIPARMVHKLGGLD